MVVLEQIPVPDQVEHADRDQHRQGQRQYDVPQRLHFRTAVNFRRVNQLLGHLLKEAPQDDHVVRVDQIQHPQRAVGIDQTQRAHV